MTHIFVNDPAIDVIVTSIFALGLFFGTIIVVGIVCSIWDWLISQWEYYQFRKGLVRCGNCSGTGLCPVCGGEKKVQK